MKKTKILLPLAMMALLFGTVACNNNQQSGGKGGKSSVQVQKINVTAAENKTTLVIGDKVQLTADPADVTWESGDQNVATVSATGEVTAVAPGEVSIKAKKEGYRDGSLTITVTRPAANAAFDLTTAAEHYSADGWWSITTSTMGYSMESGGGATPITQTQSWGQETESDKYLSAFGVGDKETVKFNASKATKAELVVNMGNSDAITLAEVVSIKLNDKPVALTGIALEAHVQDYGGYSMSTTEFADVSLGQVDLVANENVLVFEFLAETNLCLNEMSLYADDATITLVNPPVKEQIAVTSATLSVIVEETVQIETAVTGVSYESLDPTVATVNEAGVVTGVKVGKTNVTVKKEGMYSIRVEITVNPKPVAGQIIIEAEDGEEVTSDWSGGGYMRSEDGGMMGGSEVHSGSAYVMYFSMGGGEVDLTLTIKFQATEAKAMVLSIVGSAPMAFGGDAAAYVFADSAELSINGTAMTFTDQEFPAPESGSFSVPMTEVVLGEVNVQAGENTLVFHTTGAAPSIDCFKLSVKA